MLALPPFRDQHQGDPAFAAWLKQSKPLSRLKSLRKILDLDRPSTARPGRAAEPNPPQPRAGNGPASDPRPAPTEPAGGRAGADRPGHDQRPGGEPVTIDPAELTRHAAFLGPGQRQDDASR